MKVIKSHPRYKSLKTRDLIVKGLQEGITSFHGLTAHGRGEAFDYLLGEKTHVFAKEAVKAAAAMLLLAKHPVISVNGNSAALVSKELVQLAKLLDCPLEVNIFHPSNIREKKIKKYLEKHGAKNVLLPQKTSTIKFLDSNRKYVNTRGIAKADVVFVPLEDGDRTEVLIKNGKKVITIDLNPLSRTAKHATITVVDNITRAIPHVVMMIKRVKNYDKKALGKILTEYKNRDVLDYALRQILLTLDRKA